MAVSSRMLRLVGTAISDFNMIEEGDRILLAYSGGKDSLAMAECLSTLKKKSPVKFSIHAAIIDHGFGADFSPAENRLKSLGISYSIERSKISGVLSGLEMKKGHCFMCSRLRRGLLYRMARTHSCSKLALGHTLDDAIETFLLNVFYGYSAAPMRPMYKSKECTIIRPLIYVREEMTRDAAASDYLVVEDCPLKRMDSRRREIKKVLASISETDSRNRYRSMLSAMVQLWRTPSFDKPDLREPMP